MIMGWRKRHSRKAEIRRRIHMTIQAETAAAPDLNDETLDRHLASIMEPRGETETVSTTMAREEAEPVSTRMPREETNGPLALSTHFGVRAAKLAAAAIMARQVIEAVIRLIQH
jgi:hypothetical protein